LLESRTGVPVVGVVPYLNELRLPEEDAASLGQSPDAGGCVEIAVVRLPHIANFDEFAAIAAEARVSLRYVTRADELRAPDLLILPGTKATIPDLLWLHERGLADRICWLARQRTPVLGICGGYQMLGEQVLDPAHVESEESAARGLSLLSATTEIGSQKRLVQTRGHVRPGLHGIWSSLGGVPVEAYEIHMGKTGGSIAPALLDLESGLDGEVGADGSIAGTYVHGIFELPEPRRALVQALARHRGFEWSPSPDLDSDPYDRLADVLAANLSLATTAIDEYDEH
jgi:adenosylcobyric acid synthase